MGLCKKEIIETISTPFFYSIKLTFSERGLVSVDFIEKCGSQLLKHDFSFVTEQFLRYFMGKRVDFSEDYLLLNLTPFTEKVLLNCRKIPYGKTVTYKGLAEMCGIPNGQRAVGKALTQNPLPIIIPCHRVIGADGSLTGFMGKDGIEIKRSLLRLEGILI
ncbi:MAG: methylated-DNA--[protein]-cysteine S-methyltransferase [bacterium]